MLKTSLPSSRPSPPGRYYWRAQVLAWTLYGLFNLIIFRVFVPANGHTPAWVFGAMSGIIAASSLGASHVLRQLLWRGNWLARPPLALLGRLLLANAALSVGCVLVIGLVARLVLPRSIAGQGPPGWGEQLGYALNISILLSLWAAAYVGWHYLQRSRRAEIEKWRLTAAVREAELNTLRAQLNPHFLFNGLNNIRGLVSEDPARARQALAHLAELLRYVMQHSATPLVPLAQELEIVADYLALEALQLEDRLRYSLDVDPAARAAPLPPLTVQLLVENAIKHGVAPRPAGGFVALTAQLDAAGWLCLTVRSTGRYAPEQAVAGSGLGLRGLRERLTQAFGPVAEFRLENEPAAADAVLATLRLPVLAFAPPGQALSPATHPAAHSPIYSFTP
ncbi:sensor histidine kinase [Hymenobacter convexus]|uniref:sensor histidine kinase n=1 Tax=Hymenobacter sp. CA1UV-4 TaxID=3063782 RepID=UPI002713EAE1|nr:histidine kinase [Hymenobacter sp. CA1UV-4]MDO7852947.1 histidine kinase [Hymenobacter sp. CA1UV-4]